MAAGHARCLVLEARVVNAGTRHGHVDRAVAPSGPAPAGFACTPGLPWLLVGVVAAAWLALLVWGASPYGRYLSHDNSGGLAGGTVFVVGSGSVGWTLALGAVMAVEKNVEGRTRISAPVGVVLMVLGLALALDLRPGW